MLDVIKLIIVAFRNHCYRVLSYEKIMDYKNECPHSMKCGHSKEILLWFNNL